EDVAHEPLARPDAGFGELADDLRRGGEQLRASRRLHGASGAIVVAGEPLPRDALLLCAAGAPRRGLLASLCARAWLGAGGGGLVAGFCATCALGAGPGRPLLGTGARGARRGVRGAGGGRAGRARALARGRTAGGGALRARAREVAEHPGVV